MKEVIHNKNEDPHGLICTSTDPIKIDNKRPPDHTTNTEGDMQEILQDVHET